MSKRLIWDADGERLYETGVRMGVLYPREDSGEYSTGVAWNGLTGITESPSGAEATDLYADDIKYLSLRSAEELGATVEAYMYPDEFAECDGSATIATGVKIGQQTRRSFGLSYRTVLGNDILGENYAYKIHLLYGCTASPSERQYQTINDSPEANTFSWEIDTVPVNVTGYKPTASVEINSADFSDEEGKKKLAKLEAVLYGHDGEDASDILGETKPGPRLPLPDEIISILSEG